MMPLFRIIVIYVVIKIIAAKLNNELHYFDNNDQRNDGNNAP